MTMAADKDLKSILTKLQYSDDAKVVQLVTPEPATDGDPNGEPPRPPNNPRPALKRVK